jgi:hypothetical protein
MRHQTASELCGMAPTLLCQPAVGVACAWSCLSRPHISGDPWRWRAATPQPHSSSRLHRSIQPGTMNPHHTATHPDNAYSAVPLAAYPQAYKQSVHPGEHAPYTITTPYSPSLHQVQPLVAACFTSVDGQVQPFDTQDDVTHFHTEPDHRSIVQSHPSLPAGSRPRGWWSWRRLPTGGSCWTSQT